MTIEEAFEIYYTRLTEWNAKINLTAITERDEVFLKHFRDSILPEKLIKQGSTVLDVGTGAGFPGLPLKIVRPDIELTLVDSLLKRVNFLSALTAELGISANIIHSRAEDLDKTRKFDVGVSRAVAPLKTLCEYCLPFVRVGGIMIAYKAEDVEKEISDAQTAIKKLGGRLEDVIKMPLCEGTMRSFAVIKKVAETSAKYPRGGNKPRLCPLE